MPLTTYSFEHMSYMNNGSRWRVALALTLPRSRPPRPPGDRAIRILLCSLPACTLSIPTAETSSPKGDDAFV
eukprot:4351783-Pyramimonas_sp.AAC.1